jgi:pimeloyl-ACP methyl ester carboxylesterase
VVQQRYLAELLPNSEIHPLNAGHFAWEQASDEYARLIVECVTGGFQRLGGAVTA